MPKKNIINTLIILIYIAITLFIAYNIKEISLYINDHIIVSNKPIESNNTTWVVAEIITWDNKTWVIETPNNIRDYIDRAISDWKAWIDYIVVNPLNQPNLSSSLWKDNNDIMHSYLYKNRNIFSIPDTDRVWYIMFVTTKRVKSDRNIFVWLEWQTIWRLDRNVSLEKWSVKSNEYLYKLSKIDFIWNNSYRFTKDIYKEMKNNKISINAVVWESDNKVEKIIIFFK